MIEPGKIPTFDGNLEAVESAASGLKGAGPKITSTGSDVHSTFQGLAAFYDAPEASELFASTAPVKSRAAGFGADVHAVGAALATYVTEMRPIAKQLDALKTKATAFVNSVKDDDDWHKDGDKVDEHNQMLHDVNSAVVQKAAVERKCANAIEALFGGRRWHAGDSRHDKNAYGPESIPDNAATPWGKPEEEDKPWYEDVADGVVSFAKGVFVDGAWGMVKGLATLGGDNVWWAIEGDVFSGHWGDIGGDALGALKDTGRAWEGVGLLALGLTLYNPGMGVPGVGLTVMGKQGLLPSWANNVVTMSNNALIATGKGMVAWDEWGKDPARAAGATGFNVVATVATLPFGGEGAAADGAGAAARAAGTAAEDAGRVGEAGELAGDAGRVGDLAGDAGKGADLADLGNLTHDAGLPKVSDIERGLGNDLGGLDSQLSHLDDVTTDAHDLDIPKAGDEPVPHVDDVNVPHDSAAPHEPPPPHDSEAPHDGDPSVPHDGDPSVPHDGGPNVPHNGADDIPGRGPDGDLPPGYDPMKAAIHRDLPWKDMDVDPVWRTDHDPLFRGDSRPPSEIFDKGFEPRNTHDMHLARYVHANTPSAFVSTSRDIAVPVEKFQAKFVYDIDAPAGIDIPRTFGANPFGESEVAFPGGIKSEFIRGAWEYDSVTREPVRWYENSHYDPHAGSGAP